MLRLVPDRVSVLITCCYGCYYSARIYMVKQIQILLFPVVNKTDIVVNITMWESSVSVKFLKLLFPHMYFVNIKGLINLIEIPKIDHLDLIITIGSRV